MIKRSSMWQKVLPYFRLPRGAAIARQHYLVEAAKIGLSENLADTYRLYLTEAGYLKRLGRGVYQVEKDLPEELSLCECYLQAYGRPMVVGSAKIYGREFANRRGELCE